MFTKEDLVELFEGFLCEAGEWYDFKDYIEERGYTTEELGFNDDV